MGECGVKFDLAEVLRTSFSFGLFSAFGLKPEQCLRLSGTGARDRRQAAAKSRKSRFHCGPAVASIAEAFLAAATGETFTSDRSHPIRIQVQPCLT